MEVTPSLERERERKECDNVEAKRDKEELNF